ncbi:MAG: transcription antitermination factor NusB [Burkholderiales bacterium]|jgi:N utilization substance protein B|nr:transcription antitermination factor NusB [Burkholderiales bacterium]
MPTERPEDMSEKPPATKPPKSKIDFMGRRRARALVMQGLYQYQLLKNATENTTKNATANTTAATAEEIRLYLMDSPNYARCDEAYFDTLWRGVSSQYEALRNRFAPYVATERDTQTLSPVETAVLVLATWELSERLDIPYRIVLNEAIDLAKTYGGTDGHKFVNGVLDKLAVQCRADEIRVSGIRGQESGIRKTD